MKIASSFSLFLVAAFGLSACGGSTSLVRQYQNEKAEFGAYNAAAVIVTGDVGGFTRARLDDAHHDAAVAEGRKILGDKGWRIVEDILNADVIIAVGVGERIEHTQTPEIASSGGDGALIDIAHESDVKKDTLVIDVWDRHRGTHMWHAQVIGIETFSASSDEIQAAVRKLLSQFPAAEPD